MSPVRVGLAAACLAGSGPADPARRRRRAVVSGRTAAAPDERPHSHDGREADRRVEGPHRQRAVRGSGRRRERSGGCTDTIDLRGRTVIPGMIDNHFHVQLVGSRPGYETRTIETAFSIAEAQAVIRERTKTVPDGAFITAIGGLQPRQFAENRLPTLAELDAAAPRHPVYIHVTVQRAGGHQHARQAVLREQGRAPSPPTALIEMNGPDVGRARRAARQLDAGRHQADDAAGVRLLQQRRPDHRALGARLAGPRPGAVLRLERAAADAGAAARGQADAAAAPLLQHRPARGREARQSRSWPTCSTTCGPTSATTS